MKFSEIKPFVRFARVQNMSAKKTYPMYTPVDCRLFYVLEGRSRIQTKEKLFDMNKGDVIIINSGQFYHQIVDEDMSYLAVNFDFTFNFSERAIPIPPSEGKTQVLENVKFTDVPELDSCLHRRGMFSVQKKLSEMIEEYTKKLPHFDIVCSSLMASVLSEAVRGFSQNSVSDRKLNIEEIIYYVQDHYKENLTNERLSEIFHFHPNYISEVFRKKLGKSLHQYIMEVRISNAISMLEAGKMSISEIAAVTGFYDSCYFSRYFKKITGVSPKAYK